MMGAVETAEGDIGRAIPEEWIAHLDAHLHLLGTSSSYEPHGWTAEDLREMYRVYYQVLRDTGRRPSEVAWLSERPIEYTHGQPSLIYDNTKAGRHRRRLPIDKTTATVIEQWSARLGSMQIPTDRAGYLFPTPGARTRARRGHLSGAQFRRAFVAWLVVTPPPAGLSEDASAFPVENIDPYGFRHAFAQRHADSGTAIDALRDLMDHKEIETTMGYYRVTLARKQTAVHLVAQLALDRNGAAAPFPSELAYERASVATAYGNCTEPSNVKAGGKGCPIRFQCSGCGFYRPDPLIWLPSSNSRRNCGLTGPSPSPVTSPAGCSTTWTSRSAPTAASRTPCASRWLFCQARSGTRSSPLAPTCARPARSRSSPPTASPGDPHDDN